MISSPADPWGSSFFSSSSEFVGDEPLEVLQSGDPSGSTSKGQKPRRAEQATLQPHLGPVLPLLEPVRRFYRWSSFLCPVGLTNGRPRVFSFPSTAWASPGLTACLGHCRRMRRETAFRFILTPDKWFWMKQEFGKGWNISPYSLTLLG